MATIYVHGVLGDDANGGTDPETDALATLNAAFGAYSNGDTIKLKGGITYNVSTAVVLDEGFTLEPYDTDGIKPIVSMTTTGVLYYMQIKPTVNTKVFKIYNIIFKMTRNELMYPIEIYPQINLVADIEIKNCDFVSTTGEFDSTGPYGINRPDMPTGTGGNTLLRLHNCNFIKLRRGVDIYDKNKVNDVRNCLFYMCGKQTTDGAVHVSEIGGSTGILVLACHNCYFYGCSLHGFDLGIPNVEFVDCIGSEPSDVVDFPDLNDMAAYDYRLSSTSPLVDQGDSAIPYYDQNIPPAQGASAADIGSWGGPKNLDESNAMTLTLTDAETSDGLTTKTVYPYDVVTIVGKKHFIRWDSSVAAIITKLGDNRYTKSYALTMLSTYGSSFTIKGIYKREIEMTAGRHDIVIEQGATFKRTLVYRDLNEAVVDVSAGYTAAMEIRERYGGTLIKTLTNGSGITLGATTILIEISDTDTAAFTFKWAVYDLELIKTATGEVTRLLEGKVKLSKNATTL